MPPTNLGDRCLEHKKPPYGLSRYRTQPRLEVDQCAAKRIGRLITAAGRQARPLSRKRLHTSSPRLPFENILPGMLAASPQLSRALRSYHARDLCSTQQSPSPPELIACQGLQMENPQLVTSYYDLHRHSLSTAFSLLAHDNNVAVVFPAPMLQSTSGMHKRTSSGTNHGFTPMAVQVSTTPAQGRRLKA
jgi:hypothetical protein